MNDVSITKFLSGELEILQSGKGYRFSVDALLLANFIDEPFDSRIIDFGTGSGIIPLIMAKMRGYRNITGIEIQDTLAGYAKQNVEINRLESSIEIIYGDLRKGGEIFGKRKFDAVISNPPYKKPGTGKINPNNEKAIARHEIKCTLEELIEAATEISVKKGALYLIYHPFRLDELITIMSSYSYHTEKIRMIHPRLQEPASLFMIKAARKSKKELVIESPLYIYDSDGEYSGEMKSLLSM